MRYLVYVKLPGKMIEWKRGMFRTPLRLIMHGEKELEEYKIRLKAAGILPHQYEVSELDKKDEKKEVAVQKSEKPLKDIKREVKEQENVPFKKSDEKKELKESKDKGVSDKDKKEK